VQQPYADETIIIRLRPGADSDKVKEILDEVNGTVIKTRHVNVSNYDILFVKPESGKADDTIKKILDKKDNNFKSITRNGRRTFTQAVPPNDPQFTSEWHLPDLHWTQAQATYLQNQLVQPNMIIGDTGMNAASAELPNGQQYDATFSTSSNIVLEARHDVQGHGSNCADLACAVTDNGVATAGNANFGAQQPANVTMFRVTTPSSPNSASDESFIEILVYVANNPKIVPVPCPISFSFGPGLWTAVDPEVQAVQQLGFQVFIAAGNGGNGDHESAAGYHSMVIMASNPSDNLEGFSTYITDTPWAAPGCIIDQFGQFCGTSAATPCFASSVAAVQSCIPNCTALQASQFVVQTCKQTSPGTGFTTKLFIPQIYEAIVAGTPAPPPPPPPPPPVIPPHHGGLFPGKHSFIHTKPPFLFHNHNPFTKNRGSFTKIRSGFVHNHL
jgi:hypothetical protein